MSATLVRPAERTWDPVREGVRAVFWLGVREVRTVMRLPAALLPNLIIPIFFFFVMVGSLERLANASGLPNWKAFQLPVSIMFAVTGGSAGLNMVADIESGYFDKLLVTPAARLSLLLGDMAADYIRIMAQALIVVVIAMATGVDFASGVVGAIVMVAIAGVWGLAYSAAGFAVALKTGNAQATQSMWALFLPLMFLSTMFAPESALSGWLRGAATVNPMTYVLRGMRSLSMIGWDAHAIAVSLFAAGLFGIVTMSVALIALRSRIK